MPITYQSHLSDIDWTSLKHDLAADDFDNGRSPEQLERSFRNSQAVSIARDGDHVIGTARLLSDGVCNAYLIDVWTHSAHRNQGIARRLIESLLANVQGQHVYCQSDDETVAFYKKLGFIEQPTGLSKVVGTWLVKT